MENDGGGEVGEKWRLECQVRSLEYVCPPPPPPPARKYNNIEYAAMTIPACAVSIVSLLGRMIICRDS